MFCSFEFLGKTISTYALMAVVGMLVSGFFICRAVKKRGYDDTDAVIVLCFVALGVLIGSHLLFALTNLRLFENYGKVKNFSDFIQVTSSIFGGAVFYGGLLGGIGAGLLTLRFVAIRKEDFLDIMSFGAPLFHGIARIGCFLGGCCYGIESSFGFVAHGNHYVPEVNDVRRFPVQLLETVGCLLIASAMTWLLAKKCCEGRLFYLYLISYGVLRFLDEYLRGDSIRGFVGILSTSQFISVLVILFSVCLLIFSSRKKRKREENGKSAA